MKRRYLIKAVSLVLCFAICFSCISFTSFAKKVTDINTTAEYSINKNVYTCTLKGKYNNSEKCYDLQINFETIKTYSYSAKLSQKGMFTFDNTQKGLYMINNFEYWEIVSDVLYKAYEKAFGKNISGRTVEGMGRELRCHYVMNCYLDLIKIDSLKKRAEVTDMGSLSKDDKNYDYNAFCFEGGKTDAEAILIFARDVFNVSAVSTVMDIVYKPLGDEFWNNVSNLIVKSTISIAMSKEPDLLIKK